MGRGKQVVFTALFIVLSLSIAFFSLLVFDLYLHSRYSKHGGLNYRGYRGPVVGKKQESEKRIVVVGGSTALGYGVKWEEAFPAQLEGLLNDQSLDDQTSQMYCVVNLAGNNEGAYSFLLTLQDYDYLDYDLAIIYTGYNDLSSAQNRSAFRHQSPIFELVGYLPIFPLVFREKAMILRNGGNLEAAYRGKKTVFQPSLAQKSTATALEAAANISRSLEVQLGRLTKNRQDVQGIDGEVNESTWGRYTSSVLRAVKFARSKNKKIIVVTQPYLSDRHIEQQQVLSTLLNEKFGYDPQIRHVNLGDALDVKDFSLAYDGMHLSIKGNQVIARHLVEPVLQISSE